MELVDEVSTVWARRIATSAGRVVDVSREAPEPWASWMIEAGTVDPRGKTPRPSMRELAERAGVTVTTITSMVFGDRHTEPGTIDRVAAALHVDVRLVSQMVGRARSVREPYVMPDEVHLLSTRERAAITLLIRAIAEERESRGNEAPITRAGESPALTAVSEAGPTVSHDRARETAAERRSRRGSQA